MRIFVLSIVDLRVPDAQRVHLLEKWSRIAAHGHDVHLWVYENDTTMEKLLCGNLILGRVPHLPIRRLNDLSFQLLMLCSIIKRALKKRPDVVYVRNSALDFVSLVTSVLLWRPLVVELPGPILEEGVRYGFGAAKLWFVRWLMRLKVRRAAHIITVTDPIKKGLVETYGLRAEVVSVIQNAANIELFSPMLRERAIDRLGLESGKNYVGFVGNLSPWHGVDVFVEAGIRILGEQPNVSFLVVGDGMMRKRLETRVREAGFCDQFLFVGPVPYEQVPFYVASCSLMALPLINKGDKDSGYSPLKLYEYMACGRAVIASRLNGLEIVEEEALGRLVGAGDPQELGDAIKAMLSDLRRLEEMGLRGRRVAKERFNWENVAIDTEKVLTEVLV